MTDTLEWIHGVPVLVCGSEGPALRGGQDALEIIGEALGHEARWAAVPASRLDEAFFRLRTGAAGDIVQKFTNYRLGLAVVGDIPPHTTDSAALRALIHESNRGNQLWFVADMDTLRERIGGIRPADDPA